MSFRGTQLPDTQSPGAAQSLVNNFDGSGIVYSAYEATKDKLKAMVEKVHERIEKLTVHGHSQGGVYAQRHLVTLIEATVAPDARRFKALELFVHHSPAIESGLNNRFQTALGKVAEATKVVLNYVSFPDIIEGFGNCFLGHGIEGLETRVHGFKLKKDLKSPPTYVQIHAHQGWLNATEFYEHEMLDPAKDFFKRSLIFDAASMAFAVAAYPVTKVVNAGLWWLGTDYPALKRFFEDAKRRLPS